MTAIVKVTNIAIELRPDPGRVVTRFFLPGREGVGPGASRAASVVERILDLDEAEVVATMADLDTRFGYRHRGLRDTFRRHATLVEPRLDPRVDLSEDRHLLLGASFTHEYAIEGAALCNPCAVLHPAQEAGGDARFILSVRSIGEGHFSTIGFRTGTLTAAGAVIIDQPEPFPQTSASTPGQNHRAVLAAKLVELGDDPENAAYVLNPLPDDFHNGELDDRLNRLLADGATRRNTATTIANLRALARSSYDVAFSEQTALSERVLWPQAPAESQGMEDARFVRFTDDAGAVSYYATYTAFDGTNISQQLLHTNDFVTFSMSPVAGDAATGKGLALFPRKIAGRYVALSRSDRETNAIAFSDDLRWWRDPISVQLPARPWEILQLGNCGSPIETEQGWLMLTHGVGPMRTYSMGAILLDLAEPQRVLAQSREPFLVPDPARRNGYVPNVVYTCGALAHGDTLMVPYGIGDQTIGVATVSLTALLASLSPVETALPG